MEPWKIQRRIDAWVSNLHAHYPEDADSVFYNSMMIAGTTASFVLYILPWFFGISHL